MKQLLLLLTPYIVTENTGQVIISLVLRKKNKNTENGCQGIITVALRKVKEKYVNYDKTYFINTLY